MLDQAILDDADSADDVDPYQARTGMVILPDRVTVASAREMSRILRSDIRGHQVVILDMSRTLYADDTAAIMIGEVIRILLRLPSDGIMPADAVRRRHASPESGAGARPPERSG